MAVRTRAYEADAAAVAALDTRLVGIGTWLALARPWQPSPVKAAANGHSAAGLGATTAVEEAPVAEDLAD